MNRENLGTTDINKLKVLSPLNDVKTTDELKTVFACKITIYLLFYFITHTNLTFLY